jgi:hypothetical protein
MRSRLLPAAVAALGSFLAAAAVLAAVDAALVPAAVFAVAAAAHLGIAARLVSGGPSVLVAVAGVAVGLIDLALVVAGMSFIVGIETGIGLDLGVLWFAPLNGYATIAVAGAIGAAALALVANGLVALRSVLAVPAVRG